MGESKQEQLTKQRPRKWKVILICVSSVHDCDYRWHRGVKPGSAGCVGDAEGPGADNGQSALMLLAHFESVLHVCGLIK